MGKKEPDRMATRLMGRLALFEVLALGYCVLTNTAIRNMRRLRRGGASTFRTRSVK